MSSLRDRARTALLGMAFVAACDGAEPPAPAADEDDHDPDITATGLPSPSLEDDDEPAVEDEAEIDAGAPEAAPDRFFEVEDAPLLTSLATQPIARVERGRGGRSVAFRITLADGTVGYFKPEQTFSGTHWYAEIASYHLDRALGIGRVPPTVGRSIAWSRLAPTLAGEARASEVVVQPDGTVRGAFVWWIPERLVPLALGRGWERWVRIDGALAISPYVRAREYAARASGELPIDDGRSEDGTTLLPSAGEPDRADRPGELSDVILFDFLTHNIDRWGGDFTNVRTRGPGGPLVYLDNAAGFIPYRARIGFMDARLRSVQRVRARTIAAIRALDLEAYAERLAHDPLGPSLDATQLAHLAERRTALLEHVDALLEERGEAALLSD